MPNSIYMLQKPVKSGIKCFTLADSSTGYVLNTFVYTGDDTRCIPTH